MPNQPVMYLLLPDSANPLPGTLRDLESSLVSCPSEGRLRQRQINLFAWTGKIYRRG